MIYLYFDGLCLPKNPGGVACYGFVVYENGKELSRGYGLAARPWSEEATNNVAEYVGLLKGLEWISRNRPKEDVTVRGDSRLIVMQMAGKFKVRSKRLRPLHERCKMLESKLGNVVYEWVPREMNREADRLTEEAYRKFIGQGRL